MSNLSKMLSAVWGLLGLITIFSLFIIYANFPEYSTIDFQGLNREIKMTGQKFFYTFSGLFLIVNLMVYLTIKTTNFIGRKALQIQPQQKLRISVAVKTTAIGANLFLVVLMIYLKYIMEVPDQVMSWPWIFLIIGPFIIVSGLLYLSYIWINPVSGS